MLVVIEFFVMFFYRIIFCTELRIVAGFFPFFLGFVAVSFGVVFHDACC